MINNTNINSNINNRNTNLNSYNNSYNFFTKKAEDIGLPNIDLEFNNISNIQESKFSRFA